MRTATRVRTLCPMTKPLHRIVLSTLLATLTLTACAERDDGVVADEVAVIADDDPTSSDGIGTSPSDPVDSIGGAAAPQSQKPIKPGTTWCAWPPSCTSPTASCCTATCSQIGGETICSND